MQHLRDSSTTRTIALTSIAMLAFAGNSIICRLALRDATIDPSSFTAIRLVTGALVLLLISQRLRRDRPIRNSGSWLSASMLFTYAICFSFAYISVGAGAGALILFAFVQATMIAIGLWAGDRPSRAEWVGWGIAFGGLAWLVMPGVEAPPVGGAALMACAGIAWGIYSIRGRRETDALAATTANFTLSLAMVAGLAAFVLPDVSLSPRGVVLATISGAITSGLGYVIWYAALEKLSAMQAALVQLSVPAIAAAGGVLLLSEPMTLRLLGASALVIGGITLALYRRLPHR